MSAIPRRRERGSTQTARRCRRGRWEPHPGLRLEAVEGVRIKGRFGLADGAWPELQLPVNWPADEIQHESVERMLRDEPLGERQAAGCVILERRCDSHVPLHRRS